MPIMWASRTVAFRSGPGWSTFRDRRLFAGILLHSSAMRWLIIVPTYIGGLLLLPSVLIAVAAALRRTYIWAVMLCFSLAVVTTAATESYYTIFAMKRFDEKFRHAPGAAFELALFGDAVIGFLGVLLFGAALAFVTRKNYSPRLSG